MYKNWYKSKTLWLNVFLAAGTVVEANLGMLRESMGTSAYLFVIATAAGLNGLLRFLTSEKIR